MNTILYIRKATPDDKKSLCGLMVLFTSILLLRPSLMESAYLTYYSMFFYLSCLTR